ncbi:hypothetical protein AB0958_18855 [Streptomyces sp. NPDC006655]|uniref:hypothetical protein n=1 Tax=Streptomyces sp. NPDC006655 TaxID=3156898 RepID=UPI003454D0C2
MSRLARPAARLSTGSVVVARRLGNRIAAWVRRGRRDDLEGWRAGLGCVLRLLAVIFGAYLLYRLVRAVPALLWLFSTSWTIAAWRAGRTAAEASEEESADRPKTYREPAAPEALVMSPHELLVHWLDQLTRDRAGIHLAELHSTLTRHPDLAHLKRPEMRAWLDRHHITVDRTLRVGGVSGRSGVSRATIEALLQALPPTVETSNSTAPLHVSDQPVSPVESGVESGVEAAVDPHFDAVARLFA